MEAVKIKDRPSLTLTHSYPVAPEKVWRAWTEPQALKKWFGPADEPVSLAEVDVRVGGRFRIVFGGADGRAHDVRGEYREVVPNRRLVFTWTWPNSTPDRESLVTVQLRATGKGTDLVLSHEQLFDERVRDDHKEGWSTALDKLERSVRSGDGESAAEEFVFTRVVDAPRTLVWKAWTEPERLAKWWGPKGFMVHTCHLDLRPGGVFHYGMRAPDGSDMWGKFTYREIAAPERLAFIVSFSDKDGGVTRHPMSPSWPLQTLSTITFEEQGTKTKIIVTWSPYSATEIERKTFAEGREGMKQGWGGTFDQFAEYLAKA